MYNWIPAGCTNKTLALYVKLKKTLSENLSYKEYYIKDCKVYELDLPDRIVYVTGASSRVDGLNYDFCEQLDWKLDTADGNSFDFSLVSAENLLNKSNISLNKREGHRIFVDSGGAQLRFATTSFVNPYDVIDIYNKIGDMGTALDIPPRPCDLSNKAVIKCCQKIQKRNNEIFADRAREDLLLLNCIHGDNLDDNLRWADAVRNDRFTGWAFGITDQNFVTRTIKLLNLILNLGKCEHYHLFGFGSNISIIVFAYLGKYVNNITSDSTTYLQAASYREMQFFTDNGKLFRDRIAGNKLKFNKVDYSLSPCTCAACRNLKYLKTYTLDCGIIGRLMSYHNAVSMCNFARMCSNLARKLNGYEYYRFFENAYAGDKMFLSDLHSCINVIDETFSKGIAYVEKTYYLRNQPENRSKMGSIFAVSSNDTDDDNAKLDKATGVAAFEGMWSSAADVIPRYLSKEKMEKYGVDLKRISGLAEWKEYEDYSKKKNTLNSSNLWIAKYLTSLKDKGEYPIRSIKNDIIKEHRLAILNNHYEYPLSKKSIGKMIESIDLEYKKLLKMRK